MERATWYVLEDETVADPADVAPDDQGVLRTKEGKAVAMRNGVPRSRGVDPERANSADAAPTKTDPPPPAAKSKELKPAKPKGTYKTRETKAG